MLFRLIENHWKIKSNHGNSDFHLFDLLFNNRTNASCLLTCPRMQLKVDLEQIINYFGFFDVRVLLGVGSPRTLQQHHNLLNHPTQRVQADTTGSGEEVVVPPPGGRVVAKVGTNQ